MGKNEAIANPNKRNTDHNSKETFSDFEQTNSVFKSFTVCSDLVTRTFIFKKVSLKQSFKQSKTAKPKLCCFGRLPLTTQPNYSEVFCVCVLLLFLLLLSPLCVLQSSSSRQKKGNLCSSLETQCRQVCPWPCYETQADLHTVSL